VVDAYERMKLLKETAVEHAQDASAKLATLQAENFELQNKVSDLEDLFAEYKKLDMVTELIQEDHLVQSIAEINATIQRYDTAAPKKATAPSLPADDDAASLNGSIRGGNASPAARAASPSQLVLQASLAARGHSPAGDGPALNHGLRTHALLQDKLRALERLVFILKKRVLVLESNEELVDMMDKYGSVQAMLDTCQQLSEENEKLRLRELEFKHEPLLRRRACGPHDANTTPVLILALQNELTAARQVLALEVSHPNPSFLHPPPASRIPHP
jgi:hypothetical protein